jgi:hypothetical protein
MTAKTSNAKTVKKALKDMAAAGFDMSNVVESDSVCFTVAVDHVPGTLGAAVDFCDRCDEDETEEFAEKVSAFLGWDFRRCGWDGQVFWKPARG